MRYIETFREGMHVSDVYLCKNKQIQLTKNGKEYGNVVLQDKTGTIDAKIWDLNSPGVGDFDTMDYVCIEADVTLFQNSNQLNVRRIRKAAKLPTGYAGTPASFAPTGAKGIKSVFSRGVYVAENTSRPASVEFVCRRQTNYARGRVQPFRKSGRSHFFDIQKLPAVPRTAGSFSWSLTRPWGHRTGGRTCCQRPRRRWGRSSGREPLPQPRRHRPYGVCWPPARRSWP